MTKDPAEFRDALVRPVHHASLRDDPDQQKVYLRKAFEKLRLSARGATRCAP